MKYSAVLLAVLGLSSVALAGVGVLSSAEEQEVLALWTKVCRDLASEEGARIGSTNVYCKNSPDVHHTILHHSVTIPGGSVLGEQVVFIRPAPVVYKHNLQIQGGDGSTQKTKIYVIPQKAQHEISSQFNPGPVESQKPTVYFLKSDGQNGSNFGYRYGKVPAGVAGFA